MCVFVSCWEPEEENKLVLHLLGLLLDDGRSCRGAAGESGQAAVSRGGRGQAAGARFTTVHSNL